MADTGDTGIWAAIGTALGAALAALGYKRATARKDKPDMAMIEQILKHQAEFETRLTRVEVQAKRTEQDRKEEREMISKIFEKLDKVEEKATRAVTLLESGR